VAAANPPPTILPWQRLNGNGVQVRQLHPDGELLTADELAAAIGGQTRLVAVTWVDSFTGRALDLAVGEAWRGRRSACGQRFTSIGGPASRALRDSRGRCRGLRLQVALRTLRHRLHLA
jgi:hypothetical protein